MNSIGIVKNVVIISKLLIVKKFFINKDICKDSERLLKLLLYNKRMCRFLKLIFYEGELLSKFHEIEFNNTYSVTP